MFEFEENLGINAKIKVIGVGGGGGNAIKAMMKEEIEGVDFVAINTDVQSLRENDAMVKIQIGQKITRGLGSGSNPQVGREAALEDASVIRETLEGSDMVFITAGMGGGTGTGAVPVIANIAKELGILTVGIVTKPFSFEGRKRLRQAEAGIEFLKQEADTVICIPNDNLLCMADKNTPILDSFKMVDQVLLQAVRGISDLITTPGLINLDFADIKTIMQDSGLAIMGTSTAFGSNRALEAAKQAISSPLLEDVSITGATGILLNITGSSNMTLFEVNEASKLIQDECSEEVNVIFGTVIDENMQDGIRITVIATGFGDNYKKLKRNYLQHRQNSASQLRQPEPKPVPTPKKQPQPQWQQPETENTNEKTKELFQPDMFQEEKPEAHTTIRDIFNNMNTPPQQNTHVEQFLSSEPEHEEREEKSPRTFFGPHWEDSVSTKEVEENDIAKRLAKSSPATPEKPATQWQTTDCQKPTTRWGESATSTWNDNQSAADATSEKEYSSMPPRITRKKTETRKDKTDYKKIMSDMGLNDTEDEYDIPAFIRRRAD